MFMWNSTQPLSRRVAPVALALVAALALTGCGKSPEDGAPAGGGKPGGPPGGAGGPPQAMPVTVRTVREQSVPILIDAVGQAEGSKEVEVRARVTGLLESQRYTEGERVKAGAPMFTIERAPLVNAQDQARAALTQQQALVAQARREAGRLKPLAAMQAISQREADDAASSLANAEAALSASQARVRDANISLGYARVDAPITGIASRAEKSIGSLVAPTDGLLARITQTDPIWVRFSFSDSELTQLRSNGKSAVGAAVRLLDAYGKPDGKQGKLNYTGSSIDAKLGTVQLRATFPNPDLTLLPGQFVKAQVQAGEQKGWLVPQAAVATSEQGKNVWTVQDGKAMPTPVKVGGWVGGDWIVLSGLKDGDQVISDNLMKLRPGAPVAPHAPQAGPAASAAGSAPASAASSATPR